MSETLLDLDLKEVDGIGEVTKNKMVSGGISNPLDLAASTPKEIVDIIGGSEEKASQFILNAKKLLEERGLIDKEVMLADELLEKRKKMERITTGCKAIDELFGGGIETQAITEFYGEYGSGKSQLCHTLSVTVQFGKGEGGLGGGAIYLDTEGTFRPERVYEIALSKGLDAYKTIHGILVARIFNSSHLELITNKLSQYIETYNVKLIAVDSIISHYRAEYVGRGNLSERQQRLNRLMHKLLRLAEVYNVAVVVTNQVQATPDVFFGDPTKPAGGHVLAHVSTYRVYLKKSGSKRKAIMVDSPYHPYADVDFQIGKEGVLDVNSE